MRSGLERTEVPLAEIERLRVRLNGGVDFVIQASLGDFSSALHYSLGNNQMIEVSSEDRRRFINPVQIVFVEPI